MFHTIKLEIPGFDDVFVLHNEDWSGATTIHWKFNGAPAYQIAPIPGRVLVALAFEVAFDLVRSRVLSLIDGLTAKDLLKEE